MFLCETKQLMKFKYFVHVLCFRLCPDPCIRKLLSDTGNFLLLFLFRQWWTLWFCRPPFSPFWNHILHRSAVHSIECKEFDLCQVRENIFSKIYLHIDLIRYKEGQVIIFVRGFHGYGTSEVLVLLGKGRIIVLHTCLLP